MPPQCTRAVREAKRAGGRGWRGSVRGGRGDAGSSFGFSLRRPVATVQAVRDPSAP